MTLHGKTILVMGGTGFIGGRLVETLMLEYQAHVRVLVRRPVSALRVARFPVEFVHGDVTDAASLVRAMEGCDVVVDCAYAYDLKGEEQEVAARNVTEAALRNDVERLVHVSSFVVYGPEPEGDVTEATPWQASSHNYTLGKRVAETYMLEAYRRRGLPVVVLQPTIVYGPYGRVWTMQPVHELKTGIVPLVDGGRGHCNAVYVDDVVQALVLAATRPGVEGEAFLISGERPITWATYYGAFEEVLGIHATLSLSEESVRERMPPPRPKPRGTVAELVDMVRDPRVVERIARLPAVRKPLAFIQDVTPERYLEAIKTRIQRDGRQNHGSEGGSNRPLHVPNETLLALYTSDATVRIDKAREQLGYRPRFSFEDGMYLTAQFIRWARLS